MEGEMESDGVGKHRVETPFGPVEVEAPPDSLDAAWAEVLALLPEGWRFMGVGQGQAHLAPWWASAIDAIAYARLNLATEDEGTLVTGKGDTPVAALRALAAKLRERGA
jgi:hypothetical protein